MHDLIAVACRKKFTGSAERFPARLAEVEWVFTKAWLDNRMLHDILERLEAWLSAHRPEYRRSLLAGATRTELAALRKSLKRSVPRDLRGLLSWHNGQKQDYPGRFEQDWLLMGAPRITSAKRALDADAARTGWKKTWIPFLDNDAGDYLCLDTSMPKSPVRAFRPSQSKHGVIAPSLASWLKKFVAEVEKGKYVEDQERGSFLHKRR